MPLPGRLYGAASRIAICKKIERGLLEGADAEMQRRAKFGFKNCDAPQAGNKALRIGPSGRNTLPHRRTVAFPDAQSAGVSRVCA